MKPTRTTTFVLALTLSCAPIPAPFAQTAVPSQAPRQASASRVTALAPDAAAIDRLFTEAVKPDGPGLTVIVTRKGQAVHRAGYGMANVEQGVAARPDHVFRIGSVTKQFTAAVIMMLVEEGAIRLGDPLTKYLPDYPTQGRTITIEHLLTHTSGIQSYTDMPKWRTMFRQDLPLGDLIALFKNEPMQFDPGTKWRYNNSGYVLLGAIIEKVTGRGYGDVLRARIFEPLGMQDTRYDDTDQIVPRRAAGYALTSNGIVNAPYLSMSQPYAAGALLSTVDDLAKWDAGLTAGTVVKAASLEKMFAPYVLANGSPAGSGYGYGWQVGTYAGRAVQEHGGGINGFRSYVLRIPSDGVYVAVLSNLSGPQPNPEALARKAAAIAAGQPLMFPAPPPPPAPRTAIELDPATYDAFVGEYELAPGFTLTVTREGAHLWTQATGQARVEVFPSAPTEFFLKVVDAQISFVKDASGKVSSLVLHQGGRDMPAKRIK